MKNLLLILITMFCLNANAQFTVWEDDFNDSDISDWTLLDIDENESAWIARTNIQLDENTGQVVDGTFDVLGTYHIDFSSGAPLEGPNEDNWAISPVVDLSFYAAPITLTINFQSAIYGGDDNLMVYLSNSPDQASFLENEPQIIFFDRESDTDAEFKDFTVDISEYSGENEVYIAFVTPAPPTSPLGIGLEIDNVKITATDLIAGLEDLSVKTASKIKQNPVTETLQLQLGNTVNAESLNIEIYNVNGMLVKQAKYNEAGISVNGLSGGLYFLALKDGNAIERLKFIKK